MSQPAFDERRPPGFIRFLKDAMPLLRPHRGLVVALLGATIATSVFAIAYPLAFMFLIDKAIVPHDTTSLAIGIGFLITLFLIQMSGGLVNSYAGAKLGASLLADLRGALFVAMQGSWGRDLSHIETGDLLTRMSSDLVVIEGALTQLLPSLLGIVISAGGSLIALLAIDLRLALVSLLVLPLAVIGPIIFGSRAGRASIEQQDDTAAVMSSANESLANRQVLRAFGLEERSAERFAEDCDRLARSVVRTRFFGGLIGTSSELAVAFVQVVILAYGGWLAIKGQLEVGALVAFSALVGNIATPLFAFTDLFSMVQQASGGILRVREVLEAMPDTVDGAEAKELLSIGAGIEMHAVEYSYPTGPLRLNGVDIRIAPRTYVGIVGPSGSGKSTVLRLLLRFDDPSLGAVWVDGRDMKELAVESLRRRFGAVFQDPFLFSSSILENIRMGDPDASDEDVVEAARLAEIDTYVRSLPDGYDTVIGEGGGRLSGGQRQRVALARALVRRPEVLLLDEPTSALDPVSEAAIVKTLAGLRKDHAVVTVTHRLATVADADAIVVLEDGNVVGTGTHTELLERCPLYSQMWDRQHLLERGPEAVARVLADIPLLKGLDPAVAERVTAALEHRRYADRESVLVAGQEGDELHVIARGRAEVFADGAAEDAPPLRTLEEGDHFGEISVLGSGIATATVVALGELETLVLPGEVALATGKEEPRFLSRLQASADLRTT